MSWVGTVASLGRMLHPQTATVLSCRKPTAAKRDCGNVGSAVARPFAFKRSWESGFSSRPSDFAAFENTNTKKKRNTNTANTF